MFTILRARFVALAIFIGIAAPAVAHEGHDHAAPPPTPASTTTAPRVEASSDLFEVVAIARGLELVVYVDRFRGNAPVVGARVEVETPEGPSAAEITGDAYRIPAPWLAKPGAHDLIFTVTADADVEILTATLVVPESLAANGPAAGSGWRGALGAFAAGLKPSAGSERPLELGGAPVLAIGLGGGGGFVLGALAMLLFRRRGARAATLALALQVLLLPAAGHAHEGHDHGDGASKATTPNVAVPQRLPDGAIFVPKPTQRILAIRTTFTESATHATTVELPGRVIPDPDASGFVQASVGGRLSPPQGGFPRLGAHVAAGDVLAFVVPPLTAAEVSDQRQRQGELDQQIAIMERRIGRFESLERSQAVSRVQLEEARLELAGLRDRRAALDRARREPEALVAPVPGRIAASNAIAGQIAEPNAVVFHIVDPSRLWIEALSYGPLPGTPRRASARDAEGRVFELAYQGTGFADRSQAIPMHLSIAGGASGLRLGQLVTVLVETQATRTGVVVPRLSVMRGANGQPVVYEHVAAERFAPREVRVIPLDGERVLVAAGLERGRRVVTQGAELLNQIR